VKKRQVCCAEPEKSFWIQFAKQNLPHGQLLLLFLENFLPVAARKVFLTIAKYILEKNLSAKPEKSFVLEVKFYTTASYHYLEEIGQPAMMHAPQQFYF